MLIFAGTNFGRDLSESGFSLLCIPFSPSRFCTCFLNHRRLRGAIWRSAIDKVVFYLAGVGLLLLSFYVVDAIQLNSNFIRMFGREVTKWGRSVVDRSHRSPPLDGKGAFRLSRDFLCRTTHASSSTADLVPAARPHPAGCRSLFVF